MAYTVPQPAPLVSELPFHAVGGQPPFLPAELEKFVRSPRVAVLAYLRRDGRPHQSPIWYTYRGGLFLMSTVTASPKHRAIERDARVTLTIQDERPPYRAVVMEGAVDLTPLSTDDNPTVGMATRYMGRLAAAEYDKMTGELYRSTGLTLMTFRPAVVRGFDNAAALGRASLFLVRLRRFLPLPRTWL